MKSDEQEIRQLVSEWMSATKDGDVEKVLSLMTDDAVFLVAGRPEMRKSDFAAAAEAQARGDAPKFDGKSEIQEVQVHGDWAFMWAKLTVVTIPSGGGKQATRTGPTLSIFRKDNGQWRLARDANMLAPVTS